METKEISTAKQSKIRTNRPKFIFQEKQIKFGDSTEGFTNCQRIHHCSCDCNYIKCPVFLG